MATISITQGYSWTSGEVVTPAKMNSAAAPTAALTAGTIVNADISASAAIAGSKLADNAITNAKVDAAAAIAGTKIAPNFGSQNIVTIGNAGIGTATPDSKAALDVTSTTKGFLPPRMTTAERDAIVSPTAGLVLYNSTTNKLQVRTNTAWADLH
jgi:hypothetical protein